MIRERENREDRMADHPFQQQQSVGQVFLRTAPKPQHGGQPDPEARRMSEKKSFAPRPAH